MFLTPDLLRQLALLSFGTRRPSHGGRRGEHTSDRQAQSLEFAEYRPYYPGDEFRYVDWHVYLRSKKLYRKSWLAEENLTVHILVDASASMAACQPDKLAYALGLAEALAFVALFSGELASVLAIADGLRTITPLLLGRGNLTTLDGLLAKVIPSGQARPLAAVEAYGQTARRGLTIVVSDLLPPDEWFTAFRSLGSLGETRLIHLLAAEEEDPVLAGQYRLADAETSTELDFAADGAILCLYRQEVAALRAQAKSLCAECGLAYWPASTAQSLADYLLRTLVTGGFFGAPG